MDEPTTDPSYLLDNDLSRTRNQIIDEAGIDLESERVALVGSVHYAKVQNRMFQPSYDAQYSTNIMDELEKKISQSMDFWQ